MRHTSLDDLARSAKVSWADGPVPAAAPAAMTRKEKLVRWADLVAARDQWLKPFHRVEYLAADIRRDLRAENTPVALAYADPVLRAAGLSSDNYDVARSFFELTEPEAHRLLCDCHYAGGMHASQVAARIRALADQDAGHGLWSRLRAVFSFHRH